jgi:small subunit ribosomal protein S16
MLRIRLRRAGTRSRPFYRIVVSDSHKKPGGDFVETLGHYNPKTRPSVLKLDLTKADGWIRKGAVASETVRRLLEKARVAQT